MTIQLMLAKTARMAETNKPFVVCKSCLMAFDVDFGENIKKTRGPFGLGRKKRIPPISTAFEARCVYCNKLSEYTKDDALGNTDLSSGDPKLAEMMYKESITLRIKMHKLEDEIKKKTAENSKLEKGCRKLANTIDQMNQGMEKPYRRRRSNPLSS